MDNYTIINGTYLADEGYCYRRKNTDLIFGGIHLAGDDVIDNYEIIEKPIIEEYSAIEEDLPVVELTDAERIANLEQNVADANERIEFVEDCLIEMSEAVYG